MNKDILDLTKKSFNTEGELNDILQSYWEEHGYVPEIMYVTYGQRVLIRNFIPVARMVEMKDSTVLKYDTIEVYLKQ